MPSRSSYTQKTVVTARLNLARAPSSFIRLEGKEALGPGGSRSRKQQLID